MIRCAQERFFKGELESLRRGKSVDKNSPLLKLDVFLDSSGVIRVGGRLNRSALADNASHPIVLPSQSAFVPLIIRHYHEQTHHQGRVFTAGEIRNQGYWIVGLSQKVKSVIKDCVICAKLRRTPIVQKMSELPEERTRPSPPPW